MVCLDCHLSCRTWSFIFVSHLTLFTTFGQDHIYVNMTDLQVYNGTTDVTDQVLLNGTNDCSFWNSFNPIDLPANFQGLGVEKPTILNISTFYTPHDDGIYKWMFLGGTIKWQSPFSENAKADLKGFFLVLERGDGNAICRVYEVNHQHFIFDTLEFRFNRSIFNNYFTESHINVAVYSLPPPRPQMRNNPNYSLRDTIHVELPFREGQQFRETWLPTIIYNPVNRSLLNVSFPLPSKGVKCFLENFEVLLYKRSCRRDGNFPYGVIKIHKTRSETETKACVQFTGLDANDVYQIQVRCLCQILVNGNDNVCCTDTCRASQTIWFDLTGKGHHKVTNDNGGCGPMPKVTLCEEGSAEVIELNESSIPSTSKKIAVTSEKIATTSENTPFTSENTAFTSENTARSGSKTEIIIAAVLGSLGLLALLVVISIMCCRRREKRSDIRLQFPARNINSKQPSHQSGRYALTSLPEFEVSRNVSTNIKRKLVYVVAAADHPENRLLIDCLCELLKRHCQCDIVDPREADLSQTCESAWVTANIEKCDCILYIDSMSADKLLDAHLEHSIETDHLHPMFMKALHYIFKSFNSNQDQKLISLAFTSYLTKNRFAILPSMKFHLPNELPKFLRGLHNLSEKSADKLLGTLPLNVDCLSNLPEGKALLEAIETAQTFEKNNVNWFDSNYTYKVEKESKGKASSTPPGHSSALKRGLSISDTNLNTNVISNPTIRKSLKGSHDDSEIAPTKYYDCFGLDEESMVTIANHSDIHNVGEQEIDHVHPVPPRSSGDFDCDNFSAAITQFNRGNWDDQWSTHQHNTNTELDSNRQVVIPPRMYKYK